MVLDEAYADFPTNRSNASFGSASLRQVKIDTWCVAAITSLAILWQLLVIVLRFCNIGLINILIKVFLVLVSCNLSAVSYYTLKSSFACILNGSDYTLVKCVEVSCVTLSVCMYVWQSQVENEH